jgi:tRNA (guanine-N7-)-methyltransferase
LLKERNQNIYALTMAFRKLGIPHRRALQFSSCIASRPQSFPTAKRFQNLLCASSVIEAAELNASDSNHNPDPAATNAGAVQSPHVKWASTPFPQLGIDNALYARAGGARCRQHVNPLKRELQIPAEPLDWRRTYVDPSLPLAVDIGAGYGRFLLALASLNPRLNYLGLEIRQPAVDRANRWGEELGLAGNRTCFVMANATVSLEHMLSTYPGPVDLIAVQFPDPHFKKRHKKRRVVQPQLVHAAERLLRHGGSVFLQTDVLNVAEDMRDQFERHGNGAFELAPVHQDDEGVFHECSEQNIETDAERKGGWRSLWAANGWLKENPLPVPTERETLVLSQGLPVYRMLLVKQEKNVG